MNKRRVSQRGFTLLEIMITISIMGIIGILISQVFFTTTRVNTKTELIKDMKQNGQFAMDVMTRMIRSTNEISSACATTGSTDTSLILTNPNGESTTFGCFFDAQSSITRIASMSAYSGLSDYLTSQNVTLGGTSCEDPDMSLQFTCTSSPDQPSRIKILYTLRQIGAAGDSFNTAKQSFESTVSVRN